MLSIAAETAYLTDWKSMQGWHHEWNPWFEDNLTEDEVVRIAEAMKKPRGPKTQMIGRKIIRLDDPYDDAIKKLQSVIQGLVNKYTP